MGCCGGHHFNGVMNGGDLRTSNGRGNMDDLLGISTSDRALRSI